MSSNSQLKSIGVNKMIVRFRKKHPNDKIWWVGIDEFYTEEDVTSGRVDPDCIDSELGRLTFSFDKKKIHNLWTDYPHNMTKEEVELFDQEYPRWAKFFSAKKES